MITGVTGVATPVLHIYCTDLHPTPVGSMYYCTAYRQGFFQSSYLPKLSEERVDRDQPSRDVLPEDRAVFIDKKIEAARRTPSAPGSVTPDDLSIGVADERVGRVD